MKLIKLLIESEYEDDFTMASKEISNILKQELENNAQLEEALDPLSILSYILASNSLINMIAKWSMKIFKKYDFGQGAEAAEKIYNYTHHLEEKFEAPIKKVVGLFTSDEETVNKVSDAIFVLFLLFLGAKAGTEAFNAIKQSKIATTATASIKSALKGRDVVHIIKKFI